MKPGIAQLGGIMQLAYVPADPDAALAHWLKIGAGPFFALDHVQLEDVRYRGRPAEIDFSMVLGYWGDLQVEIIRQFIGRCGVHLSSSIQADQPARYAKSYRELIDAYVTALQRTSSIFRRL